MTTGTIVESLTPNDIYSVSSFLSCRWRVMYRRQNVDATSTNIRNNSAGLDPHLETLAELLDRQILSDFALIFFK